MAGKSASAWFRCQAHARLSVEPYFAPVAEALARTGETASQSIAIPAHERGRGGRKKIAAALPRVEVVHDLSDGERVCAADGTAMVRIGEEISEQLDFKTAQVRVIRHIRPKYACPCCHERVAIAPVPQQLLPKSLATASLLAHIATAKFVDGIPLHRQESQLSTAILSDGSSRVYGHVR